MTDSAYADDAYEIQELMYQYARGLDRRDLDLVRSCYHDDATHTHGDSYDGDGAGFVKSLGKRLGTYTKMHHLVGNVLVDVKGAAAATETYVAAHTSGHRDGFGWFNHTSCVRWLDRLERRDAGPWRIARRIVVFDWVAEVAAPDASRASDQTPFDDAAWVDAWRDEPGATAAWLGRPPPGQPTLQQREDV